MQSLPRPWEYSPSAQVWFTSGQAVWACCSPAPTTLRSLRFHDGSNPPSRASQAVTPAPPPAGRPLSRPQPCLDQLQDSWLRCYFVQKLFLMPAPPSWAGTTVVCSVAPCPPSHPPATVLKASQETSTRWGKDQPLNVGGQGHVSFCPLPFP